MTKIHISLSNQGTKTLAMSIVSDWSCPAHIKGDCAALVVRYIDSLEPPFKLLNLRKILQADKDKIISHVLMLRKLIDDGLHRFPEE